MEFCTPSLSSDSCSFCVFMVFCLLRVSGFISFIVGFYIDSEFLSGS